MTQARTVAWMGGPWDGQQVDVPDDLKDLKFAESDNRVFRLQADDMTELAVQYWSAPIEGVWIHWYRRQLVG